MWTNKALSLAGTVHVTEGWIQHVNYIRELIRTQTLSFAENNDDSVTVWIILYTVNWLQPPAHSDVWNKALNHQRKGSDRSVTHQNIQCLEKSAQAKWRKYEFKTSAAAGPGAVLRRLNTFFGQVSYWAAGAGWRLQEGVGGVKSPKT